MQTKDLFLSLVVLVAIFHQQNAMLDIYFRHFSPFLDSYNNMKLRSATSTVMLEHKPKPQLVWFLISEMIETTTYVELFQIEEKE